MLPSRRARHDHVAASLAARDDAALAVLLSAGTAGGVGVGGATAVVDVDGVPVLAKRVPVTDRELAHPRSTSDLYGLPTSCGYGMHPLPGPGGGAWRELAAYETVTDGVLAGETDGFALLHHWRVLPGRPPVAGEHGDVEAVVAQFGGHPGVRARLEDLAAARASVVLLLEYLPDRLPAWLADPVGRAEDVERQLGDAVAFLRSKELLHMDGHLGNVRADDERLYLVDLGLATSPRFDLSPAEREFVARNVDHDADHASMRLVNWLVTTVCGVDVSAPGGFHARNAYVRRCADHGVPPDVPEPVAGVILRHARAAARMNDFCWRLVDGEVDALYG